MTESHIVWIDRATGAGSDLLGGKGASLARLTEAGLRVPPGFVVTTAAFRAAVGPALLAEIDSLVAAGSEDAEPDDGVGARVRELIGSVPFEDELAEAIGDGYGALGDRAPVAVRSSSAAEDSADHSFAGEHDTHLWVSGTAELLDRIRDCWASLFTARAMDYRRKAGLSGAGASMAVVVQLMVPARAAGVFMTLNPENGDRSKVACESVWGLGEPLVSGTVTPDRFYLDKVTGEVTSRDLAAKETKVVRAASGQGIETVAVAEDQQRSPSLAEEELAELLRMATLVERHFGCPQDGEFAVGEGEGAGNVFLVQSRPETVWSRTGPRRATGDGSVIDSILSHLVPGTSPRT
ncbi:PEP/pyruvate-binding domain-containing protein [Pseudonocardia spinosispora]|uniref:PEP/pyruvate-binding domain-containing protein n=1 Tax=Pseudonocardia spinosispora TaxID=103441 RepID=UPI0004174104|nr:PEP/pyruvate-binding domain-containing protein [Pseudonocardia spinosispora]